MTEPRLVAAGDSALIVEFEERIDPVVNARATALADALGRASLQGIRDIVPTFRSVAVHFDPLVTDIDVLAAAVHRAASSPLPVPDPLTALVDVPVCYDSEFGPDLEEVAAFAGISVDEVIAAHTGVVYRVFMLGFLPGFAYLGSVNERIAAPRRRTPRTRVPAGSVAIAGAQTGVYPSLAPGGWNLVGRTPIRMVSFEREQPALLRPGQHVRFRPIARAVFDRLLHEGASA